MTDARKAVSRRLVAQARFGAREPRQRVIEGRGATVPDAVRTHAGHNATDDERRENRAVVPSLQVKLDPASREKAMTRFEKESCGGDIDHLDDKTWAHARVDNGVLV